MECSFSVLQEQPVKKTNRLCSYRDHDWHGVEFLEREDIVDSDSKTQLIVAEVKITSFETHDKMSCVNRHAVNSDLELVIRDWNFVTPFYRFTNKIKHANIKFSVRILT